ncbi:hypothetical protein M9458_001333 [Cirrhinus mrigala]|uniref:Uncharacterized protein n=1 Tax=Cirrhinus mrigala TaxID=683832 RepID=A0ABD0S1E2_CIRMR
MEGFWHGLEEDIRFVMPRADPCWSLKSYINFTPGKLPWIAGSAFTVGEAESSRGSSHVSVTSPESSHIMAASLNPSQLPPCGAELPEPTADREPEPAAVIEPLPSGATEPQVSDLVREPAAEATVEAAVEIMEAMESLTHCTTAEGEQELDLGDLIGFHSEIPILLCSPERLTWENIPPNLLLPPPLIDLFPSSTPSPLDPVSPSAHPQLTICGVGSPLVYPTPAPLALSLEDPPTPSPASEAQTLPQFCDPTAPPWLPGPLSPPETVSPPAPPGSLIPPRPLWSVVPLPSPRDCTPLAAPRHSIPPALLGSSFPPAPPQSSVAPAPPRPSSSPPTPQSPKPPAPPWPSGSSASPWLVGSPSPPWAPPPPGVVSPSSTMAPPSIGSMVGHHHDRGPGLS